MKGGNEKNVLVFEKENHSQQAILAQNCGNGEANTVLTQYESSVCVLYLAFDQ